MKADRIVLGIAVVFIGATWLLVNMGVIPAVTARQFWRYWPLLLILWGILLLLGKDNGGVTGFLVVLLVLALVWGGFFTHFTSSGRDSETFETSISHSDNVHVVRLQLVQHAGELNLSSHQGAELVELKMQAYVKPNVSHKETGEIAEVIIEDQAENKKVSQWKLSLTENMPVQLLLQTGATKANLDFSHLQMQKLEIKAGAGDVDLKLGQADCDITIESGASNITVNIPPSVGVRLRTSGALMSVDSDQGRLISVGDRNYESKNLETKEATADIHIKAAAGNVTLHHD